MKSRGYNYLLIENVATSIKLARENDILCYNLDLTQDKNLKKVGIGGKIEALFSLHKDKNLNLFVTFSARNIDKNLKIITIVEELQDKQKMILAGANRVISPNDIGGYRISRMIKKPNLLDILDSILFRRTKILRTEITIMEGSFLDGVYLHQIKIEKDYDLILIGIQNQQMGENFIFSYEEKKYKIEENDIIVVLGYEKNIQKLKNDLREIV